MNWISNLTSGNSSKLLADIDPTIIIWNFHIFSCSNVYWPLNYKCENYKNEKKMTNVNNVIM